MLTWIENTINQLGYAGIVFLMALENVFPPLPSEVIMPLAGFTAAQGDLSFVGVVLAGTAGSVAGAIPLYGLGWWIGLDRLRILADRHGAWLLLSAKDIDRVDAWFDRYGSAAVLLCRLVPGVRSLISIPAGFTGMNFPLFLLYTAVGAGLWATLLALAGTLLQENYEKVEVFLGPIAYLVILAVLIWWIARVVGQKRKSKTPRF